jgi:hypothetical protein
MKTSAYLSVFDDYDLLGPAMAKIAPRVDEIVVVDGAYRWMAPFFNAIGRDPTRSVERLREVMAPYAHKTRWINQLWENEPDKRAAGYAACSHRWIWRLDADEVHFVNDNALDRFFSSGKGVAEMELPIYVAPALIRGTPGQPIERNSLLFDSEQVDAQAHLRYLWLVVPQVERERIAAADAAKIFGEPISFTAHLTGWRPPLTAVARARFYVMNWLRENGTAQAGSLFRYDKQAGFGPMLQQLPPPALMDTLLGHAIVAGLPDMGAQSLLPTPLTPAEDASFALLYAAFLAGLAGLNQMMTRQPRTVAAGLDYNIDLSTPGAAAPFLRGGVLHFSFDERIAAARGTLDRLHRDAPFVDRAELPVAIEGGMLRIAMPPEPRPALRRVLRLAAWPADKQRLLRLRARL